jgi:uncharacterized membrane protein
MSLPRPAKIALLASLLLNAALIAVLAVWMLGTRPGDAPEPSERTVSEPQREQFRAAMAPHREQLREHYAQVRAARAEVGEALRAEPFDPARLADAFSALREAEARASEASHRALTTVATELDVDARARMAERIESRRGGHRSRGGRERQR